MTRVLSSLLVALLVVAGFAAATPGQANAQDNSSSGSSSPNTKVISGRLINGTDGASFDPTKIAVTLDVFQGITALNPITVQPDAAGNYSFTVDFQSSRTYFLSADYEGATYSATVSNSAPDQPADITVYEATSDPSVFRDRFE